MAIALPDFKGGHCQLVTACGELLGSTAQSKSLRKAKLQVARYRTSSGTALVRAWIEGKGNTRYLHVDCALREYFPKGLIPKITHKKAEVTRIIERVVGRDIDVSIVGCFEVPMAKLPEGGIIRLLSEEQKTTSISMKMTQGTFSLTGAPIKRIEWRESKDKKRLLNVIIEGDIRSTVSEKHMCEMWEWIEKQFKLFVLGQIKLEKE